MKLQGKQVYLRKLILEDADGNYPNWLNDKEVCRYNSHGDVLYTKKMAIEYIKSVINNPTCKVFAICLHNDTHIGNISLQDIKDSSAEFAILMGEKEFWGKGYAKEAGEILINYGLENLNLNRIYCGTNEKNLSMQKLALSLKMTRLMEEKKTMQKNGKIYKIYEYEKSL